MVRPQALFNSAVDENSANNAFDQTLLSEEDGPSGEVMPEVRPEVVPWPIKDAGDIDMQEPWQEGPKGKKYKWMLFAYHPSDLTLYGYKLADGGPRKWQLMTKAEARCAHCKEHDYTCLCAISLIFGIADQGACVWCSTRSLGCSIAHGRRGKANQGKGQASEVGKKQARSEDSEDGPRPRKEAKVQDEVENDDDSSDWVERTLEARVERMEASLSEEKGKETGGARQSEGREVGEVRQSEGEEAEVEEGRRAKKDKKMKRSERSAEMRELIVVVRDVGQKVGEVGERVCELLGEFRAANDRMNRADVEFMRIRRRRNYLKWMQVARDLASYGGHGGLVEQSSSSNEEESGKDSEESEGEDMRMLE